MNALKSICTTVILTLSLAASIAAGELTTPGYTPPPPPPPAPNLTVDLSATPIGAPSDQVTLSTPEVLNILWFLASIF